MNNEKEKMDGEGCDECSSCDSRNNSCGGCGCGSSCGNMCGGWGWRGGRHHLLVKIALKLLLLAIVFWMGVKVGEFKALFIGDSHWEHPGGYMMMRGWYGTTTAPKY